MNLNITLIIINPCLPNFYYLVVRDEEKFLGLVNIIYINRWFGEGKEFLDGD